MIGRNHCTTATSVVSSCKFPDTDGLNFAEVRVFWMDASENFRGNCLCGGSQSFVGLSDMCLADTLCAFCPLMTKESLDPIDGNEVRECEGFMPLEGFADSPRKRTCLVFWLHLFGGSLCAGTAGGSCRPVLLRSAC